MNVFTTLWREHARIYRFVVSCSDAFLYVLTASADAFWCCLGASSDGFRQMLPEADRFYRHNTKETTEKASFVSLWASLFLVCARRKASTSSIVISAGPTNPY